MIPIQPTINAARIDETIHMISRYVQDSDLTPLIQCLEGLKQAPDKALGISQLSKVLNTFGPKQGAILTYAPYLCILLSDQYIDE